MSRGDVKKTGQSQTRSAVDLLMELLPISGKSGEEAAVAAAITAHLRQAGVAASSIEHDRAHAKSPHGGQCGNLIVKLPGNVRGPRRLLMAHIDTVPLCVGCEPVRKGEYITSKNPRTALGGDNRAGATVVLWTALEILRRKLPHPPLTLFWPVQEEVGLVGARYCSVPKLGKPSLCFNWDGGDPSVAAIGAIGADDIKITVEGIASHAGAHPEDGVSAIGISGLAIQELVSQGWHGLIKRGSKLGTSNIGLIHGGDATNVVTDRVELRAEARSHDPTFRASIVEAYVKAFAGAARRLKNVRGESGSVEIEVNEKYEAFAISVDEPVVQAAKSAITASGLTFESRVINGGLDANWMTLHGLPTVTLGCGQQEIHTVKEQLHVPSFLKACDIALRLATIAK